jgi:hypothetical protein
LSMCRRRLKALYEAAREVFERVKVTVQRLVELFVEAVTRVLAWVDEHKAYLFLMAAVAAGAVALSAALNIWGLIELDKLAYAASLTPFIPAGVKEYSREEAFNVLWSAPDPYEKFKDIAKAANAGRIKLAEPWESLRMLILPKKSEEKRLMWGWGAELYSHYLKDENYKRAIFYAALALEEAFGVYKSALRKYAVRLKEAVQKKEVGEEPFKRVAYMPDLGQLKQLAEEESKAFENALRILRERLNEYAVKYGLGDLLNVEEGVARELAEAMAPELSEFKDVSFGVKALATLIAYRERALGGRVAFGTAAKHWLEVGGSAWLLYYAPKTAYNRAEKARAEKPTAVEEMVAEAFRRLFLKPGADHYSRLVEELTKGGKLALMLEEAESSYVFKLEEGGGLKELGLKLRIAKVGEEGASIVYFLELDARWREFFKQELKAAIKAAEEVGGRLPVEDSLPYMLGWVDSDVAISRRGNERGLQMTTSHLWQLAETKVLFGWSYFTVLGVGLTLEGPKPQFYAYAPLDSLDEAIRRSAEGGWLKMLGIKAESWDGLKQWVADHWDEVIDAVKKQLKDVKVGSGFDLGNALEVLEGLRSKLADDKTAREVIAPALLLIQAKRLGGGEEAYRDALRYFAAVVSGAVGGDGHVSSAMKRVGLASGKHAFALLWKAALAAYGVEAEVREVGGAFFVAALGDDAVKLARLYFLFGPPLLEGDDRFKNHKLAEAVKLGAEGLDIRWERLRKTKSGRVAADLTISEAGVAVKYNVYLRRDDILLQFASTDRSHAELAARLLRLAGVGAEVRKESGRDQWYVYATTDMLATGRKELRDALAEIVRTTVKNGLDEKKAEGWLEKLEKGRVLREGWPKYSVRLTSDGALEVKFGSTSPDSIEHQTQRLREMGLEEGRHFTVKMPEEGRDGYVYIRREGLAYAAWLSVYGSERQRELATEFVSYILQRAEEEGKEVSEKAQKIIEEGRSRGSLKLEGFEGVVEVDGREHVVKVLGGGAEFDKGRGGKPLLRIRITAEVDGVKSEYMITFGRFGKLNVAMGRAYARPDAPGGKEADAERLAALIKALTGREPKVYRMKDGTIMIKCHEGHLEGFMRYAELANHIMKWLEETGH